MSTDHEAWLGSVSAVLARYDIRDSTITAVLSEIAHLTNYDPCNQAAWEKQWKDFYEEERARVAELETEVERLKDHLLSYEGRAMAAKQEAKAAYRDACQMAAKSQLSEEGLAAQVEQNRKLKAVVDAVRTTVHVKTCYETDDYGDCACGVCVALAALDKHDRTQP